MNGYNVMFYHICTLQTYLVQKYLSVKKNPVGIDIMQTKQYITTVFTEVTIIYEMIAGCKKMIIL